MMSEQQATMPPQSPIVNQQAGFVQQQWSMGQQQPQYHQFNQRGMPPNQGNSNPPTPLQQMPPPPNLIQQQSGQPQSPIVPQMNQQMGMGQRNPMGQGQFGHPQFMHSQFGPMANQIPPPGHHQYQPHAGGPAPPPPQPPPPHPPPQLINLPIQLQPEFRVYEMNRRLASRNDNLLVSSRHPQHDPNYCYMWYDSFVNEFFDENARLNIRNVQEENVTKNYSLSRALIPRFFRSFSDDECTELNFQILRGHIVNISNISSHQQIILYESDSCIMNCKIGRPMYAKLCVEGTLVLECVLEASMPQAPGSLILDTIKIKNFTFAIKRHQELIPRSAFCALSDNNQLDKLSANITKTGLLHSTIKYLKICSVLEPMQELMLRHKMSGQPPRDCLKAWSLQRMNSRQMSAPMSAPSPMPSNNPMHFQRSSSMVDEVKGEKTTPAPADNTKNSSKRRKRKPSPNSSPNETKKESNAKAKKNAAAASAAATANANQHQLSSSPVFNFSQSGYVTPTQLGDVMVVGEPSLMGGDFGEEDERLITRLENNQFDSMVNQMPTIKQQGQFVQQRSGSFGDESRMMPPRPQSTSHFVNSTFPEQQNRSLTPSPSTSNVAPKTPTSSTLTPQNQMVDLNMNGTAANTTSASASSSKSPSIANTILANGSASQTQQPPSTSTSTSAVASSSASLSPNSLFNSSNTSNVNANAAILSPSQTPANKQAQLNSSDQSQQNQNTPAQQQQQQQQKGIFL